MKEDIQLNGRLHVETVNTIMILVKEHANLSIKQILEKYHKLWKK